MRITDLTRQDLNNIVEALTWQINSRLDEFPLAGDRAITIKEYPSKYVVEDIDEVTSMLQTYKKLIQIRDLPEEE